MPASDHCDHNDLPLVAPEESGVLPGRRENPAAAGTSPVVAGSEFPVARRASFRWVAARPPTVLQHATALAVPSGQSVFSLCGELIAYGGTARRPGPRCAACAVVWAQVEGLGAEVEP